jgi:phosphoglycerate dehydrogenase-like enzyme
MIGLGKGAVAFSGTSIRSSPITGVIMDAAPDLRIIGKYTIGVDDVDVDAATARGILVTHCPTEANWGGVAETTMAMLLAITKKVRERDSAVKAGRWREVELLAAGVGPRGDGYRGLTIGLIGFGRIGKRLADLLAPWRVKILAHDPYVTEDAFLLHGVQQVDLDTLLQESDVVSMHVTLTPETKHMCNQGFFAQMKKGAIFINTSRGLTQDEASLAKALESGQVSCAALDVFEDEPLASASPLLKMGEKVLLSPHMSSQTTDGGLKPGIVWTTKSLLKALRGEVPDNVYNKEVIPRWLERFGGNNLLGA